MLVNEVLQSISTTLLMGGINQKEAKDLSRQVLLNALHNNKIHLNTEQVNLAAEAPKTLEQKAEPEEQAKKKEGPHGPNCKCDPNGADFIGIGFLSL